MMKQLKLFIWTEFCPDYTDGLAFAIAENEAEAREMVEAEQREPVCGKSNVWEWGVLEIRDIAKCARCEIGGG